MYTQICPIFAGPVTYCHNNNIGLNHVVAPVVHPEVMDQTLNEGSNALFTCQATGDPVPTISWYFNGAPVDEANTMKYIMISNTLIVINVQSSDVGTYACNATNIVTTDTSSGVLTVNGKLFYTCPSLMQ